MSPPRGAPGVSERARLLRLLRRPAPEAARGLIGCLLLRRERGRTRAVRIVETEAYLGQDDPAAHARAGRTARTEPLWGEPGTLYVYFVYGMHHCLNLAVDESGRPGCVLVRAAEPLEGSGLHPEACRGPGRLCRALAIDTALSGRHLFDEKAALTLREGRRPARVAVSARVGISRAVAWPLRFYDPASPAVSASRPAGVSSSGARRSPFLAAAARARKKKGRR